MSFARQVARFNAGAVGAADKTVRAITLALFRETTLRTPVDTGRLRGNWQTTVGAPAVGTTARDDKTGAAAIAEVVSNVSGLGTKCFLTNNLPYAARIEFDGYSKAKAPAGMVRVSLRRITALVRRAIRENRL